MRAPRQDILKSPQERLQGGMPTSAFTLLEVLVVVAIIALLVAILLPTMSNARQQGKRAACLSNLHQIALAWHQYLSSNKDKFFQLTNANYNYGGIQGSGDPLFGSDPTRPVSKPLNKYLKLPVVAHSSADVFFCPADIGSDSERPTVWNYYGTSYTTNTFLIGQDQLNVLSVDPCRAMLVKANKKLKGISRSGISGESRLLLIGDFGWIHQWNTFSPIRVEWHGRPYYHDLAYMDGHAEFLWIHKGLYITPKYTLIPFRELLSAATACQQEVTP